MIFHLVVEPTWSWLAGDEHERVMEIFQHATLVPSLL